MKYIENSTILKRIANGSAYQSKISRAQHFTRKKDHNSTIDKLNKFSISHLGARIHNSF